MGERKGKSAIIISAIISKLQLISGIVVTAFFGLAAIGMILGFEREDLFALILGIAFAAGGVLLIRKGIRRGKQIKLFRVYATAISKDPAHSIDHLAKVTNDSVDAVRNNVEQMINKGYFANATLVCEEDNELRIVFDNRKRETADTNPTVSPELPSGSRDEVKEIKYIAVVCKGCGAMGKIAEGSGGECEFCGSYLK